LKLTKEYVVRIYEYKTLEERNEHIEDMKSHGWILENVYSVIDEDQNIIPKAEYQKEMK